MELLSFVLFYFQNEDIFLNWNGLTWKAYNFFLILML